MKKLLNLLILFITIIALNACYTSRLGTREQNKKYALLNRAIKVHKRNVNFLQKKLTSAYDSSEIKIIRTKLKLENLKISTLQEQKEEIFYSYLAGEYIPIKVSSHELRTRRRSNQLKSQNFNIQRERLVLEKVRKNLNANDSSLQIGLKVILDNEYVIPITFKIRSMDGGERTAYNLRAGEKLNIKLIPGKYSVSFWNGGRQLGHSVIMTVNGQKKIYQGEYCFAFAYMPRW